MKRHVNVLGVGMTQFKTPKNADPYTVMGHEAGQLALTDAGLSYLEIEQAYVGFVYGNSTAGQRLVYELGMSGIPVFNVNNNCATGSSALFLARQAVESGMVECALALGFEQMTPGALAYLFNDRPTPLGKFTDLAKQKYGDSDVPMAPLLFGGAGREYIEKYGAAALKVYEDAGIGPEDVKVVELHDCFTTNEVLSYEALGLTAPGTAERMIEDGDNTYGGKYVVNPSGGLISKGHPLGATGLAQCAELNWHLRDEAGERQVEGARIALQHNIGLGGCCVVTLYERTT